jgi:hypothetical protein
LLGRYDEPYQTYSIQYFDDAFELFCNGSNKNNG